MIGNDSLYIDMQIVIVVPEIGHTAAAAADHTWLIHWFIDCSLETSIWNGMPGNSAQYLAKQDSTMVKALADGGIDEATFLKYTNSWLNT